MYFALVMATGLFGELFSNWFGTTGESMHSLFQMHAVIRDLQPPIDYLRPAFKKACSKRIHWAPIFVSSKVRTLLAE